MSRTVREEAEAAGFKAGVQATLLIEFAVTIVLLLGFVLGAKA